MADNADTFIREVAALGPQQPKLRVKPVTAKQLLKLQKVLARTGSAYVASQHAPGCSRGACDCVRSLL